MKRREFIAGLGGTAATWPVGARAQQSKMPVIGFLFPASKEASKRLFDVFQLGMQQRGYLEGRDYVLESRYAENSDLARLPVLAEELVRLKPNVIVCATSPATQAAKQATEIIPIVGVNLFDPVGLGLVNSEARPGTNITGNLQYLAGLTGKQLEFTRDLLPNLTKIGVLANVNNSFNTVQRGESEAAAAKLGVSLTAAEIRTADEIGPAFQTFVRERVNVVLVLRDQLFLAKRQEIAAFALASRLPTIYAFRDHVESGGLISYGIDIRENYRRAAFYVDRILKGEKPADLPIEFPTKLELVINLTTAKALGLEVPLFLQQRADEVIE